MPLTSAITLFGAFRIETPSKYFGITLQLLAERLAGTASRSRYNGLRISSFSGPLLETSENQHSVGLMTSIVELQSGPWDLKKFRSCSNTCLRILACKNHSFCESTLSHLFPCSFWIFCCCFQGRASSVFISFDFIRSQPRAVLGRPLLREGVVDEFELELPDS